MAPETSFLHATLIRLAKGMVSAVESRFHRDGGEFLTSMVTLANGMISAWELWTYQATGRPIPKELPRQRGVERALAHAHELRARVERVHHE